MNGVSDIGLMASAKAVAAWRLTCVSALLHFLVDGLCVCCLYLVAGVSSLAGLAGVFIAYNVLAFLTQPLTGMLADRLAHRRQLLWLSALLLSAAVAVASLGVLAAGGGAPMGVLLLVAVLLGLGNSLFHVWGGKEVAMATGNDIRTLGVFVSTGAFGLAVGVALHSWWALFVLLALFVGLVAAGGATGTAAGTQGTAADATGTAVGAMGTAADATGTAARGGAAVGRLSWVVVLLMMGFVLLRSFAGETLSAALQPVALLPLLVGGVAMVGKAAGGWVARGLGWWQALLLLTVATASCVLWRHGAAVIPWAGLLLVNATMAVTLWLANRAMPRREGLTFGLLAAALMPGYLLAQAVGDDRLAVVPWLLATLVPTIVLELLVLWLLRERRADVLWSSVVVNMLTNVPLNLFVTFVSHSWTTILVAEVFIVAVEALWYRYFVDSWRQAMAYSVLCNGISFFTGLLVQLVFMLFDFIH